MTVDPGSASMRVWEPLKGKQGDDNGSLGCAIVLAAGRAARRAPRRSRLPGRDAACPPGGKLVYHVGSTWDRGSKVRDAAAWGREVQALAARVAAPVKVSVSAPAPK